jgi:hypothetical protein
VAWFAAAVGGTIGRTIVMVVDESTEALLAPIYILSAVVVLGILVFCAYLCARNGRWGWFVAGFLCTPFCWIIGAVIGSPRARRRY